MAAERQADGAGIERPANVAIIAYRRPVHLRRCLEALSANIESKDTAVTVYVDGPRSREERETVDYVAAVAESFTALPELRIVRRSSNLGLSRSIIGAVEASLEERDNIIVLEDDLIVSPYFLRYMNDSINRYRNEPRVASVHGYVYPVDGHLPETFFLRGADCLGWATWRSAWTHFEPDEKVLLTRLESAADEIRELFDFNGAYPYLRMLCAQVAGRIDSWAIRWYASAFLADKLTLYPGRSLVLHAGSDGSGTNVGATDVFDVELTPNPIVPSEIPLEDDERARLAFEEYFRRVRRSSGNGSEQGGKGRSSRHFFRRGPRAAAERVERLAAGLRERVRSLVSR